MARVSNWPKLLNDAIACAAMTQPAWGSKDCCLMAADLVQAITGKDPAAVFRGTYSSRLGAARIIAKFGGVEALAESIAKENGWSEIPVRMAGRGDLVLRPSDDGRDWPALGIGAGAKAVFPTITNNVRYVLLSECSRAWRVN